MFIEPFNFSFFSVTGWAIDLDYRDIEWFALDTKAFEIASKSCILDSSVDYDGYSISSKGWTSPDGQHRNQIDYILCSQRWRSSIQSAKTNPRADCGSDHELLKLANSDLN